jgi:hypothetical protein
MLHNIFLHPNKPKLLKHLESQDLHSKASQERDVLELGDPRSSIGVQNLINNACLIIILCCLPFSTF